MSTQTQSLRRSFAPRARAFTQAETRPSDMPDSVRDSQQQQCVPQLMAARANAVPDAPALTAGNEVVTYRELNDRANQLANYLITLGVGADEPDDVVALCLDRSVTGVVCALAVLKAGAAYLPLDPGYPTERLAFMLNDAQPRVLITSQALAEQFTASPWEVIAIDRDDE